jgi:hypothetical protein
MSSAFVATPLGSLPKQESFIVAEHLLPDF